MKTDESDRKSVFLFSDFTDEQIKTALKKSGIDLRSPFENAMELIEVMKCYVVYNEEIDKETRDEFYTLYCHLNFNLELIKQKAGIEL